MLPKIWTDLLSEVCKNTGEKEDLTRKKIPIMREQ